MIVTYEFRTGTEVIKYICSRCEHSQRVCVNVGRVVVEDNTDWTSNLSIKPDNGPPLVKRKVFVKKFKLINNAWPTTKKDP